MSHPAFPNTFRQGILSGKRLIGCWCSLANPITTEILGLAGFDWLLLDGEHAPNDVTTFIPQLMALKDSASAPVVRPSWNDAVEIKRLLDAGFYNFLVPMVESVDEARRAVAATRYPPKGVRGVSVSQRSNRFGSVPDYFACIDEQICVLVQIESRKGLQAATEIASVDGVDGVFVGPADLHASLGYTGEIANPKVKPMIDEAIRRIRKAGKAPGILTPNEADAKHWLSCGGLFVAVGADVGILARGAEALAAKFKS
jgi:2-dehydro-3-deoxyglucarate aldolase